MNILEDNVYLSFARYEKYGDKVGALVSYQNDQLEGTYVIHLSDFSAKKLSSQFYGGIYVFDDGYVYACSKKGSVYQFNRQMKLVETILDND